ncbi:deoxyribonuclease IV [Clostridium sp. 'deep sea']|uniref:deoxyribonuclease IV n=1 Tax=Clostridium sp. 'deep sea' TaxID=2779445 RepID=UPI0018966088|nr:deoxyribonuclease IV [Clostridium sp. 'deep sea']QOR35548.1 deoxyribonuclease IV [Clostridium sp. 'deep sea']
MNLGCHLSISKGFKHIYETAKSVNATTFQFFSRNPRGSSAKKITEKDILLNNQLRSTYKIAPVVAHLPYTVNAASPTTKVWQFACDVILKDLERMNSLGVNYLVMHPGSFAKSTLIEGLKRIIKALEYVFTNYNGNTILCLETMSGKGTEIGKNFEELQCIIDSLGNVSQLGVCLDCCHLFAAGYDFLNPNQVIKLVDDIEKRIGMNKVYISHINDSQNPCGSNKDRHAKIGEGLIGDAGISNYVNMKELNDLPLILETPVSNVSEYKAEIAKILSYVK